MLLGLIYVDTGVRAVAFAFGLRGVKVDLLPPRFDPGRLCDPVLLKGLFELWQVIAGLLLGDRLDTLEHCVGEEFKIGPEHV